MSAHKLAAVLDRIQHTVTRRGITVDAKSYDLALHFLQDYPVHQSSDLVMSLAQEIQRAAEDWLERFGDKD